MSNHGQLSFYHSTEPATEQGQTITLQYDAVLLAGLYETPSESTPSALYRRWLDECEAAENAARRADEALRKARFDLQYYRRTQPGCVQFQETFVRALERDAREARRHAADIARREPDR